ncbi:MAG: FKBP-type peptidyl-prolyl cis-trans isomerase [Bacteroidota bacterium]|nr:FKBP-type peptidyl-prolyl cis-trans isomerase [Bacteroidota bacterium]
MKYIKAYQFNFLFLLLFLFFGISCRHKNKAHFSYNKLGYYYQLLSFNSNITPYQANSFAWISASFKTQSDSVFWDSQNNFNENFFLPIDSNTKNNFFKNYISKLTVLDSGCLLIKTKDFYLQQFNSNKIPFFSKNDSVVKIDFKIRQILSEQEYKTRKVNLLTQETEQIEAYFKSPQEFEMARDSLGFYWIEKPENSDLPVTIYRNTVKLSYQGSYLNGRVFEKSPDNFEISYGTPDQLIKGLNFVIKRLKKGQNAKIILPSRLAFGENGSSDGAIAPYTPLIYEIKIIDVKNESVL